MTYRTSLILAISILALGGCSSSADSKGLQLIEPPAGTETEFITQAQQAYERKMWGESIVRWNQLREGFPGSYYIPLAELKIADSRYFDGQFIEAIAAYEDFIKLYPTHEAVSYAMFQIGNAHLHRYTGRDNDQSPLREAIQSFASLSQKFPLSPFSEVGSDLSLRAKLLLANYYRIVADFYERQGHQQAAAHRRKQHKEMLAQLLSNDSRAQLKSSASAEED